MQRKICPEYSLLQQRRHYLCTITHESAMCYLDICQLDSAFVMVVFVQTHNCTSNGEQNKRLEEDQNTQDCGCFCLRCCGKAIHCCLCKTYLMEMQSIIVHRDYPLRCELRTIPFRLSQFLNTADLLSYNRSASPPRAFPFLWSLCFSSISTVNGSHRRDSSSHCH